MSNSSLKSSILVRMGVIFILTMALMVPLVWVRSLISERQAQRQSAIQEVTEKWADAQTIVGPILTVPVRRALRLPDGSDSVLTLQNMHILPETLEMESVLGTDVRYRGIYEVVLYNTNLHAKGSFDLADVPSEAWSGSAPQWQDAYLTVGITDLRGIKDSVRMIWDDSELRPQAGVRSRDIVKSGISMPIDLDPAAKSHTFDLTINLNGSSAISFAPVGKRTHLSMRSSWPSPSFTGAFLPDERSVDEAGFTADWDVLELNRKFPQWWMGANYLPDQSDFGLSLLLPVDHYQKTMRSIKYAIIVIALTFLALFLSEVLVREILHPVHYTLMGLALVLFYVLLLSLSEHIGFDLAYLVSSLGVLLPVTLYARAIVSQKRVALLMGGLLVVVYSFFYVLLRLEDYALLIGSLALLLVLSAVMYVTRKVDWFDVGGPSSAQKGSV